MSPSGSPAPGRAPPSRSGSQYPRKRASQACLTCRARKSRCDNQRPKCGFCLKANSECNYPKTELTQLDRASLLILDRLERVEENVLGELGRRFHGLPQSIPGKGPAVSVAVRPAPQSARGEIWINGDRVMTWAPILELLHGNPFVEPWRRLRHDIDSPDAASGPVLNTISPTILADDPDSGPDTFAPGMEDGFMRSSQRPELENLVTPDVSEDLLKTYILCVQSRYPILDLNQLRHVVDSIARVSFDYRWPLVHRLPSNLTPLDVAMYLITLALGEIATKCEPQGHRLPSATLIQLALPWLGLSHFGMRTSVKCLQVELLLAIYHMWSLRPWRAWQVVEAAATHAEKLLLKNPELASNSLGHRILWSMAKMQLELTEELQMHRPAQRTSKLLAFMTATTLPEPPREAFAWPGLSASIGVETWYYYLAETSSRRLIERIKTELYAGSATHDRVAHFVSLHPVACELERQINEWSNSLPTEFKASHSWSPGSAASPSSSVDSMHQAMGKYLWNRQCQLRLLVFRPFVAVLAEHHNITIPIQRLDVLISGARRYLAYSIEFFNSQALQPERHYGSWLFCRNLWTTALTILAACNTPEVFARMASSSSVGSPATTRSENGSGFTGAPSLTPSDGFHDAVCSYSDALSSVGVARTIMSYWVHESPSVAACLDLLTILLTKTRERLG